MLQKQSSSDFSRVNPIPSCPQNSQSTKDRHRGPGPAELPLTSGEFCPIKDFRIGATTYHSPWSCRKSLILWLFQEWLCRFIQEKPERITEVNRTYQTLDQISQFGPMILLQFLSRPVPLLASTKMASMFHPTGGCTCVVGRQLFYV